MLDAIADAKLNLAVVLLAAGKDAERLRAIEEAAALYEQKRHLVGMGGLQLCSNWRGRRRDARLRQ